jgi:hypothetical protein
LWSQRAQEIYREREGLERGRGRRASLHQAHGGRKGPKGHWGKQAERTLGSYYPSHQFVASLRLTKLPHFPPRRQLCSVGALFPHQSRISNLMAALSARDGDSRAAGFLSGDGAVAPFTDHTLDALALFEGPQSTPCSDRAADLAAGRLDNALLLASSLAPDADDLLVIYSSLTPRARDKVVASMGQWVVRTSAPAPETPAEAMAVIEDFQRSGSRSRSAAPRSTSVCRRRPRGSPPATRGLPPYSRPSPSLPGGAGARMGTPASSSSPGRRSAGRCPPPPPCGARAHAPRRSPSSAPWHAAPRRAPPQASACSRWPTSCTHGP